MTTDKLGLALVGCGHIAGRYAQYLAGYDEISLAGATDVEMSRAEALTQEFGGQVYPDLDSLLADPAVGLVVNLTIHQAHYEVTRRCLEAGKHVHSEKPLALTYAEARELVELAERQGLRLGCSPFTFMGEGQQTAWRLVREGRLGQVRLAYAEVNWGRIEHWHPNPAPFYAVGPLFDVGVYPLTLLTAIFGPARRVWAYDTILYPQRQTKAGQPFTVEAPDLSLAVIELADGLRLRLTCNFYVPFHNSRQQGLELHGDLASLHLSNWHDFDGQVQVAEVGEAYETAPPLRPPFKGVEWGRAVRDMAQAIRDGRPHRATGAQAAHIVEILEAIHQAAAQGGPVEVTSNFEPPAMMDWSQ